MECSTLTEGSFKRIRDQFGGLGMNDAGKVLSITKLTIRASLDEDYH